MKYIRGFLMAWGMFCWIPCPYKKWREEDRRAMVAMLPLVGTFMGLILCLCWWGLWLIGAGQFISGVLLTGAYFLMTGFIHLDGFMDCSDATLPRHAEMETRVRILKDSHSGAFAVICVSLMFMIFAGAMVEIAPNFKSENCMFPILIFTASRMVSAICVLLCEPMASSQYARHMGESDASDATDDKIGELIGRERDAADKKSGEFEPIGKGRARESGKSIKDVVPTIIIFTIVLVIAGIIAWFGTGSTHIGGLQGAIVVSVVVLAAVITGIIDRKMLGGMNGDISGHMITMSEMFGVSTMALMLSI